LISISLYLTIEYAIKVTIMIVNDGPKPLNFEVPNKGRTKLVKIAIIDEKNIPKKQYFICNLSMPVECL
jgi:hypothetical protein